MGFDTPNGSDFKIPVSDTQAYRQFGNAVVVPAVQAIAREMSAHIHSSKEYKTQTTSRKRHSSKCVEDSYSAPAKSDESVQKEYFLPPISSHRSSSIRQS